ncbi:MAG: UTP--glucose-1-phosphate uridylyltransferase [Parachlamydiales bacterium]|nr:UTP--glucose-1-phosphate uridylyltransferase [Candidatus Acheromyda pituitae]
MMTRLSELAAVLRTTSNPLEKLDLLNRDPSVVSFMERPSALRTFLAGLSIECEVVIKSLIALGQAERLLPNEESEIGIADQLRTLIEALMPVEKFYREIGGLVGYHALMLHHLQKKEPDEEVARAVYHRPQGIDLFDASKEVREFVLAGISLLSSIAEIYPVGGAADRLRLHDPQTKVPLPAAKLQFCGKTLLEWMVHDLQAREYLYYKLFKEQVTVPIAMMTSQEKDNHAQILSLCNEKKWFGRPASSFAFFCQPAVPTMDKEGNWCLLKPMKPLMKPGGHGVIWKLAKDQGIFDWLSELNKKKVIVRQINNPVAGCDYGLLAFTGVGCKLDKQFGFASCLRQVKAAEGVNVLIEKNADSHVEYCLTNIEYCDFEKFGIEDVPVGPKSCYSQYPSNTNILFADIARICNAVSECPIPGMIVNLKKMTFLDEQGETRQEELARLESTMQNIADSFVYRFSLEEKGNDLPELDTFLTYNHRHKTISTVKKEYAEGGSLLETPEGCYWDLYQNAHELLEKHCRFSLPEFVDQTSYLLSGPAFDFSYHPSLGPIYSIIAQKLRKGKIARGSQLHLEIAEIDCENLSLRGRLSIMASNPMGHLNEDGKLHYSDRSGRCKLLNVSVINDGGLLPSATSCWKREGKAAAGCEIFLHGDSEFEACNVTLSGDFRIEVEDGFRVIAIEENGKIELKKEKLGDSRWHWVYQLNDQHEICLK